MTLALILFIFGLAMGSFFNVCIYRIPRNKSLVFPASHCPNCKKPINPYDNIPIISYIILKGKCRYCKKTISTRYPIVELLTALLFAAAALKFGPTIPLLRAIIFISFLLIVTFIDLDFQIAPFPWYNRPVAGRSTPYLSTLPVPAFLPSSLHRR